MWWNHFTKLKLLRVSRKWWGPFSILKTLRVIRKWWNLSDCNGIRTHNHLVRKRTLSYLKRWNPISVLKTLRKWWCLFSVLTTLRIARKWWSSFSALISLKVVRKWWSFYSIKTFKKCKKVTKPFFSGHASLSFHVMQKFTETIFFLSVPTEFLWISSEHISVIM